MDEAIRILKHKEITNFNEDNSVEIINDVMMIIKDNCDIDRTIIKCLNYCLFEVADNVQNHAETELGGYVVAQYYPNLNEIIFCIMDCGIGIHKSLIKSPQYSQLTPEEALYRCIEEKVTRGYGRGNGLYHTSNFIRENRGVLKIFSRNHVLKCSSKGIHVSDSACWNGTLIFIKIKTNNGVVITDIFGENIPVTVEECDECIMNLW